jgi:hypothetical protein
MPLVKIELDQRTYNTLIAVTIREWRPTQWQAEMLLRRTIQQEGSAYEPVAARTEKAIARD